MEKIGITITKRKDGRYVGKFIANYTDNGKTQYQYVYGKTYEEAESKVLIGREIATRYLSGRYITVGKVYQEWLNAVVNRVKESTLANYQNKFEKHILPDLYKQKARRRVICKLCEGYIYCFQNDAEICTGGI